jgi:hypothetical protein
MFYGSTMFIDRVNELPTLKKHFATKQADLFVLFNRGWVGKIELLSHFSEDKR